MLSLCFSDIIWESDYKEEYNWSIVEEERVIVLKFVFTCVFSAQTMQGQRLF